MSLNLLHRNLFLRRKPIVKSLSFVSIQNLPFPFLLKIHPDLSNSPCIPLHHIELRQCIRHRSDPVLHAHSWRLRIKFRLGTLDFYNLIRPSSGWFMRVRVSVPKLLFQFVRKSMMQEVLSLSSCRNLSTSWGSQYFPFISRPKSYDSSTELLKMSSDSLSKRHIDPSSNVTWNKTISCATSAPMMRKYDWYWTCSMYVSPLFYRHCYIHVTIYSSLFQFASSSKVRSQRKIDVLKSRLSSLLCRLKRNRNRTPVIPMLFHTYHSCSR